MRLKSKKRLIYLVGFILLFIIELFIALYIHDNFVRPYIGDVLVVVVIYFFIRIIVPEWIKLLPLYIFIFAAFVELMQLFNLVQLLGLENFKIAKIIIGSTFDPADIICYFIGCVLILILEIVCLKNKKKNEK